MFGRFLQRICELFDLHSQRRRMPSARAEFTARMALLHEEVRVKPLRVSALLRTIFQESRRAVLLVPRNPQTHSAEHATEAGSSEALGALHTQANSTREIEVQARVPSWYYNTVQNRGLHDFYERRFWKLYDIMQLDRYALNPTHTTH